MPKVLAPGLKCFGVIAGCFSQPNKRISKTVRVKVIQSGTNESITKEGANRGGSASVLAIKANHFKLPGCADGNTVIVNLVVA